MDSPRISKKFVFVNSFSFIFSIVNKIEKKYQYIPWCNKKNFIEKPLRFEQRPRGGISHNDFAISVSFSARNASAVIRPASLNFYYQAGCCLESGTCMTMLQIGPPVCQGEHTGSAIGYTQSHRQLYIIFTRSIKSIDQ